MGATVLDGAVIGTGSIVAAGALVTKGTKIPPNSLVVGMPAKVVKTLPPEHMENIHAQALKYKTLWTERYALLPHGGGEVYDGHKIV
ncbi:MAG: gamma carbonic anhydrase family protein, partial [Acidaminococcaceae bacterium]